MSMIRLKTPSNKDICCFIADTPEKRSSGLDGWGKLPIGAGLLFEFPNPEYVVFHMSEVWYPIDIVMMDDKAVVQRVYRNCQPGTFEKFPGNNIKFVLELPANDVVRLGIGEGSALKAHRGLYEFSTAVTPELLAIHCAYNGYCESGVEYGACVAIGSSPVAWGWNKTKVTDNPTNHAEMVAISDAVARGVSLEGTRIISSHQPCMMCAGACAWSKFSEVTWFIPATDTTVSGISNFLGTTIPKMTIVH